MNGSDSPLAAKFDYLGHSVALYWFSGTGNTEAVTDLIYGTLESKGVSVHSFRIEDIIRSYRHNKVSLAQYDFIGIGFPVHAFNAPRIVFDFVRQKLPEGAGKKVFLYASAGGPTVFNDYASYRLSRLLSSKGFDVFNTQLFYISANLMVNYGDAAIRQLHTRTADLVRSFADELLSQERYELKFRLLPILASYIFTIESIGAKRAARRFFAIDSNCIGCGKCARSCPKDNITLADPVAGTGKDHRKRPVFGNDCVLCLRCVYGCPKRAINLKAFGSLFIKGEYDIAKILSTRDITPTPGNTDGKPVSKDATGPVYGPLAKYIYGDEKRRKSKIFR